MKNLLNLPICLTKGKKEELGWVNQMCLRNSRFGGIHALPNHGGQRNIIFKFIVMIRKKKNGGNWAPCLVSISVNDLKSVPT